MTDLPRNFSPQRLMAFDFGTGSIGIAVGQMITKTAEPISPIKARDGIPNWEQLQNIIEEWQPDAFIVGLPLNMDGSISEMSQRAKKFANRLTARFQKPNLLMDERLSTFEAKSQLTQHSGNFKQEPIDSIAAQIILESWFNQLEHD